MEDRARQCFAAEELAVVLSRYDLGVIESVTEFKRGSPVSPKVGIVCERGKFLLKKRAPGRSSARRVAFAHAIQSHLSERGFPVAPLIKPRIGDARATRIGDDIYELFAFVAGQEYASTPGQTQDAGRVLAMFHELVADMDAPEGLSRGSYHDVNGVRTALNSLPSSISSHDSVAGFESHLEATVAALYGEYDLAAEAVHALVEESLPVQIIHADWHPGNMLFKRDQVVAVVDYDSCRASDRTVDVANGMLHFSLISGGRPETWPENADEDRIGAFCRGYQRIAALSETERHCLPHLMIEAIIAESVLPIVQTGHFGRWAGFGFLKMIARKVSWLREQSENLVQLAGSCVA